MRVYAIADLHLSLTSDKPMDVFGDAWHNHTERIEQNWREVVQEDDLVLIPGDISWAMQLASALPDLEFIGRLPGKKALLRGNHDYWWSAVGRVRASLPKGMYALQNDALTFGDVSVCGTRGWLCPGASAFVASDEKIYRRELDRLRLSIRALPKNTTRIAMLHFPPFGERSHASDFTDLLEQANVSVALYGHLHGEANRYAFEGMLRGVEYRCVSADKLGFRPIPILPRD